MKKKVMETAAKKRKSPSARKKEPKSACGIGKQYLKSRPVCKVTFRLPKEAAPSAKCVAIVGDFNNWDGSANLMKMQKNGNYTVCLELEANRQYRYRYLVDDTYWENDWNADRYEPNDYGSDDSVVTV
jgi:1,4-alpha-glucan branching enzyme